MDSKRAVQELLEKLPDDCTLDDVLYHLYVLRRISEGAAEANAGELIPHEQVEQELRLEWALGADA